MLDLILKGGDVVDGTGAPRLRADVGIRDGRIVAVGTIDEPAWRTIDVAGRVVAPGFIDVHTHLDAQLLWDPYAAPSSLHGFTTVIAGNCGFGITPLTDASRDYVKGMLSRVEGISLAALEEGPEWSWSSTAEYLDRLEGRLGVNAGFLVGHSTLRRAVMGAAATEREATPAELESMREILRASIGAGGLGFSTSWAHTHNDHLGNKVPSRYAADDEVMALCAATGEFPGTMLEAGGQPPYTDGVQAERFARMSAAANRPINFGVILFGDDSDEEATPSLAVADRAREIGGAAFPQLIVTGANFWLTFATGFIFDGIPGWMHAMTTSRAERLSILRDPAKRAELRDAAVRYNQEDKFLAKTHIANWPEMRIVTTVAPQSKPFEGRLIGEIAAEQGKEPFDALMDIVVADELGTVVLPRPTGFTDKEWKLRAQTMRDSRAIVAASDAGAHLDFLAQFNQTSTMLDNVVRQRKLMPLEEAIHYLTDRLARLFGLRGRGRIAVSYQADVVVFDPETIASGPVHMRADLPGGASRTYAAAIGIDHVLVNGEPIVENGAYTDAMPGRVLRSGRDTDTVLARDLAAAAA